MLNINAKECDNQVTCVGTLETLSIEERDGMNGKYVFANFVIKTEQDINGKMYVNRISCSSSASEKNSRGEHSKKYDTILSWKDKFIPLASCPETTPEKASRVMIGGAKLKENAYYDQTGTLRENWKIDVGFLNPAPNIPDDSYYEITGVLLDKKPLLDENGEETGDIKMNFAIVGYNGKVEKLEFVTNKEMSPTAADFIMANWEIGETIPIYGIPFSYVTTNQREIEQAFGGNILKNSSPKSHYELILTKGPASGFDVDSSYDPDEIKAGLAQRKAKLEEKKNKKSTTPVSKPKTDFGF